MFNLIFMFLLFWVLGLGLGLGLRSPLLYFPTQFFPRVPSPRLCLGVCEKYGDEDERDNDNQFLPARVA